MKEMNKIGGWTFVLGLVVAIIVGLIEFQNEILTWVLIAIGLVVGFLNVTGEESEHFLMSGVVLIIATALGKETVSMVPMLANVLNSILLLFVPATIIVAAKNVFVMARR